MKNEFVPYEEALALKEIGFDEPCVAVYYGDYDERDFENGIALEYRQSQYYAQKGWSKGLLVPTFSQAFRWFREKYGLYGTSCPIPFENDRFFEYNISDTDKSVKQDGVFNSYEEAELSCLRKLIEIVNQMKEDE